MTNDDEKRPIEPQGPNPHGDDATAEPDESGPQKIEVDAEPSHATNAGRVYEAPPANPFRAPRDSTQAGGGAGSQAASSSSKGALVGWAVACHLAGLADFGFKFFAAGLVATLVIWLIFRGEDPEVEYHGKESLNLQLNLLFWQVVAFPLVFCLIGIPMLVLLPVVQIVMLLIGAYRASEGERWQYPGIYRVIR